MKGRGQREQAQEFRALVPARDRRRRALLTALAFAAVGFLIASFVLARALSGAGVERARVTEVLRAQARGDTEQVLAALPACRQEPACISLTRMRTARLTRQGRVQILAYEPSVRITPTAHTGIARVACRAGAGRPVVQCVGVRRSGMLSKPEIELLSLSDPIPSSGSCAATQA